MVPTIPSRIWLWNNCVQTRAASLEDIWGFTGTLLATVWKSQSIAVWPCSATLHLRSFSVQHSYLNNSHWASSASYSTCQYRLEISMAFLLEPHKQVKPGFVDIRSSMTLQHHGLLLCSALYAWSVAFSFRWSDQLHENMSTMCPLDEGWNN